MDTVPSPSPSPSPSPLFLTKPLPRNASLSSASSESAGSGPLNLALPSALSRPEACRERKHELELEGELAEVPLSFLSDSLRKLGPSLLKGCSTTTPILPQDPSDLPPRLSCTLSSGVPSPSHLLAITFADTGKRVLAPVHGLSLALASPILSELASDPSALPSNAESSISLPVVRLSLPSMASFPLLHDWMHLRSPKILLASLEKATPTPSPKLESFVRPVIATKRAAMLHGLWSSMVALEISDEELWALLQREWKRVVEVLSE